MSSESDGASAAAPPALREEGAGGGFLEAGGVDTGRSLTQADRRTERFLEKMEVRYRLAKVLTNSGLLPRSINTPEKAMTVMLKGYELGVPPMQSFSSIHVVQGNPTLSGSLMMALCIRDANCKFAVERKEPDGAEVRIERPGWEPYTGSFDRADAERAGLLNKDNWRQYPTAMHFWRAVSDACRTVCPDILAGMHTPEEIEPELEVDPETGGLGSSAGPEAEGVAAGARGRTEELRSSLSELKEGAELQTADELAEEQGSAEQPEEEEGGEGESPAPEAEGAQAAAESPNEEPEEEPEEGVPLLEHDEIPSGYCVTVEGPGWYLPRQGGPEGQPLSEQKEDGSFKRMRAEPAVQRCVEHAAEQEQEDATRGEDEPNRKGEEFFRQGLPAKELRQQIGRMIKAVDAWGVEEIDRWARVTFWHEERIVQEDGSVKLSELTRDELELLRDQIRDGAKALRQEGEDLLSQMEQKMGVAS